MSRLSSLSYAAAATAFVACIRPALFLIFRIPHSNFRIPNTLSSPVFHKCLNGISARVSMKPAGDMVEFQISIMAAN